MVLQDEYCDKCDEKCGTTSYKWCKCQINDLKITNQFSGNEQIDNLIQEIQSNIKGPDNVVFEWIPYNQFVNIKKIGKNRVNTMYSTTWKDGPLNYSYNKMKYLRNQSKKVNLKYNLQYNDINEFLNEVYEV